MNEWMINYCNELLNPSSTGTELRRQILASKINPALEELNNEDIYDDQIDKNSLVSMVYTKSFQRSKEQRLKSFSSVWNIIILINP